MHWIFITLVSLGILGALAIGAWYVLAAPGSQTLCPAISSGPRQRNVVALTFDDGPGQDTPQILAILREHKVRATFFLCGTNVERFPDLAKQIARDGHCIGNHAYSHRNFLRKSPAWITQEITMCTKLIQELSATAERISPTHHRNLFRPPFGLRWFGLADILKQHNLQAVMWDVNGEDWKRPPQEISRKVVKEARAGSIILLHDGMPPNESGNRANTAQALPEIIRELSREYKLVTIPELMGWPEKQARGQ